MANVSHRSIPVLWLGVLGCLIILASPARAQTLLRGEVVDASDNTPLAGANIAAEAADADSLVRGTAADGSGRFELALPRGAYRIRISFVGFTPDERSISMTADTVDIDRIFLNPDPRLLDEIVVEEVQERVVLRGDTTVFNADAYRVNPDASAEDLVRKLPGVIIEDGSVQAQGEEVRRVLVNGEEFFGDDPAAALRNLPAEIIQEIEVYDRQSDQARFTGFDDGNEEKTLNVVTRRGMQTGQFGNLYGGLGSDSRYRAGGALNVFAGARRISIIGLANNINQQNFGREDLVGLLNSSAEGSGGGRRGGGGYTSRRGGGGGGGSGDGGMRGAEAGNYLIGEQGGINVTNSIGINYLDRWGERIRVNGSYFFNHSDNDTEAALEREYFLEDESSHIYSETSDGETTNANHRLNARLEAALTESTEFTFTPRFSLQQNTSESNRFSLIALPGGDPLRRSRMAHFGSNLGYSSSANLLIRHRFATRGRTISSNAGFSLDGRRGDTDQDVESAAFGVDETGADSVDAYLRRIDSDGTGRTYSARLAYTEPVGGRGMIQFNYSPSLSQSVSDQAAFRFDPVTAAYSVVDSANTRDSYQDVLRHRGGIDYRYRTGSVRASLGLDLQNERISFEQRGPRAFDVYRSYLSVLPSANLRLDLSGSANVNLSYRQSTSTPRVNQLRDVVDDSNPLLVTSGNPDLRPSTSHRINVRLRSTRRAEGRMFMAYAHFTSTSDYVGTAAVLAARDTVLSQGVLLARGGQYAYPVNLNGQWSARTFLTYGRPVPLLRSNLNATAGASLSSTPRLINGTVNRSDAAGLDGRLYLGSNISQRLDFSLSYGLNYTTVANTSGRFQDDAYFRHRGSARFDWMVWRSFTLSSEVDIMHFTHAATSADPTRVVWNAGIGYKFLGNELAEVRLTITDILGENSSIDRSVTGLYIEDSEARALGRYVMLNLTYRLRHFGM